MRYIHSNTSIIATPCSDNPQFYLTSDGLVIPKWLFEDSNDWEICHEIGTRVWDSKSEIIYAKLNDKLWVNTKQNLSYNDILVRKNIKSDNWLILLPHERVWTTMEGRQIPFSKVTQKHWSNIFHYHMQFGQSIQCELALQQLRNNNWELLPQSRFL